MIFTGFFTVNREGLLWPVMMKRSCCNTKTWVLTRIC